MTLPARLRVFIVFVSSLLLASRSGFADKPAKTNKQTPNQTPIQIDLSQPLTLDQAIRIALQNQPTLGIARADVQAQRARITQAESQYYPSIAPTFTYSSQLTTQTFNGQRQTGQIEQSVTRIGLQQLIFDMGKREENVLVARYGAKASQFNVLDTRQTIIQNVATNYYELLRRKDLVKVAQSSVDRAKTTLDFTRAAAQQGTIAQKDVYQAEADYDNAVVQLSIAQNDVKLASTNLKTVMGILTAIPIMTPDQTLPSPPPEPDSKQSSDYLAMALGKRNDVKREEAIVSSNRHSVKVANINAGLLITSTVTEGYRVDPDPGEDRNFTTSVSYPLFDAGLTRAAVRIAKATLQQTRLQLDLTKQNIQFEVEQAYLQREEARSRVSSANAAVKAARINYDAATAARQEGAGTIIEVITAQNALVTAENSLVQAIYDFYSNDARLKRAIADNDPYLTAGGP